MEYLVIDTESCTGRADDGSLCSLGYAICDEKLNILCQEDLLFNPMPKRFQVGDKKNAKRTGITFAYSVEEFRKAPKFCDTYSKIKDLFKGRTVLGFSMSNDVKYLNDACDKYSLKRIDYKFYDIQYIYQLMHPDESAIGLKTLNEKYSVEYLAHRSDEDAAGSVMLLKKFLEAEGTTFKEVVKKYKLHRGVNSQDGYYVCYSDAVIEGLHGLKISKRIQSYVFADYLKNLPYVQKPLERICFSAKIEKMDVSFTRTLIDLCYEKNFVYDHDTDLITVFVTDEKEDKRIAYLNSKQIKRLKIMSLNEFCKFIGYSENFIYSDKQFLTEFYKKLTK
ncbi:MAG: hypothetical protein IKA61_06575 [Clostridia bacterium]|nr:hypothetical protein [Clostridia bacterium]